MNQIKQLLKKSREGEGTLTLKEIAEILKEVLSRSELDILIAHLRSKRKI